MKAAIILDTLGFNDAEVQMTCFMWIYKLQLFIA